MHWQFVYFACPGAFASRPASLFSQDFPVESPLARSTVLRGEGKENQHGAAGSFQYGKNCVNATCARAFIRYIRRCRIKLRFMRLEWNGSRQVGLIANSLIRSICRQAASNRADKVQSDRKRRSYLRSVCPAYQNFDLLRAIYRRHGQELHTLNETGCLRVRGCATRRSCRSSFLVS